MITLLVFQITQKKVINLLSYNQEIFATAQIKRLAFLGVKCIYLIRTYALIILMDLNWFQLEANPVGAMYGHYNYRLVQLSFMIAILASYVALDIAAFLSINVPHEEKKSNLWLFISAFSMGAGIWSMHFIGMLAFKLPMTINYVLFWTITSMLIAIFVAWWALFLFTHQSEAGAKRLIIVGVIFGLAIASVHYLGMMAMTADIMIRYQPGLFFLSIIIAICSSELGLWIALKNRNINVIDRIRINLISTFIIASGIAGTHYIGMRAAIFFPNTTEVMIHEKIDSGLLGFYIAIITVFIIAVALAWSTYKQFLMSKLKKSNDRLIHQATHDPLTGLPNRVLLFNHIQKNILFSNRRDENNHFMLCYLNLDDFKFINDSLNHSAGDNLLQQIATSLRECLRESDILARLDGDEFAIILFHSQSEKEVLKKLMDRFKQPFIVNDRSFKLSVSIGVSRCPDDASDAETLIRKAELAMYKAKALGKNSFQLYTLSLEEKLSQQNKIKYNLQFALEKKELFLQYQPIINLTTHKVVSVEALLRWNNPELGLVPPKDFIPIAEQSGLIVPIGDWVLKTACEKMKDWQFLGFKDLKISVNCSINQINEVNFVEKIAHILSQVKLDPNSLELEITESIFMEKIGIYIDKLIALKKLGVFLTMDDFGTGYSNLGYLKTLPFDKIKIDISFINGIPHNSKDVSITLAIIAMAKSLQLKVLAEGVETKEQLLFLENHHCDEAQGFLDSRSLEPAVCETFIKIRNAVLYPK